MAKTCTANRLAIFYALGPVRKLLSSMSAKPKPAPLSELIRAGTTKAGNKTTLTTCDTSGKRHELDCSHPLPAAGRYSFFTWDGFHLMQRVNRAGIALFFGLREDEYHLPRLMANERDFEDDRIDRLEGR